MEEIPLFFATEPGAELLSIAVVHAPPSTRRSSSLLKQIESYLFGLEGVSNASVWERDGHLSAYVCIHNYSDWNASSMKRACHFGLGKENSPDEFHIAVEGTSDYAFARLAA